MAVQNMMLEAASCNIASVCMGRPTRFKSQREKMRKVARVEKGYEVPYIIAVGFAPKPNEQYEVPERKKYDQVTIQL